MSDRNRSGRNDRNHSNNRDGRRKSLEWREDERIQHGTAIGTINSAVRDDGTRVFSWCLGKEGRRDDRVMKFLEAREQDFSDAHKVIDDIDDWIKEERAAERGP